MNHKYMPQILDPGIEDRLDCPKGEEMFLIVQLEPNTEAALNRLRDSPASVREELPLGYYAINIEDSQLDSLTELEPVTSIDIDSEVTVFESDFLSHPG
jgi:hypothetical protein